MKIWSSSDPLDRELNQATKLLLLILDFVANYTYLTEVRSQI